MSEFVLLTGPILAGTQFNWGLLGLLTLQVYIFHISFPKESVGMKALVYGVFLIDVVQTALSSHFAFGILVSGWGNPEVLVKTPWSSIVLPLSSAIISATVQLFFAWRIYILNRSNRYITIAICSVIVALALMQSLSAIVNTIRFALVNVVADFASLEAGVKVWLAGSAVCDVVITATMIVILSQYRKQTPWKKTDSIITKLIYHTVETGAVTSAVAIVELVLFLLYTDNFLHQVPSFMLGKMYSNVMLATLNARTRTTASPWTSTVSTTGADSHQLRLRNQGLESGRMQVTTATEVATDIHFAHKDKGTFGDL